MERDNNSTWNISEGNVGRWDSYHRIIAEFIYTKRTEDAQRVLLILHIETRVFEKGNDKALTEQIKKITKLEEFYDAYEKQIEMMHKAGIYHLVVNRDKMSAGYSY